MEWTDSQSAAAILVNEGGSWRTRHLKMRSGYARQQGMQGEWRIGHVPGQEMVADLGTKSLTSIRLDYLKEKLGMRTRPSKKEDEAEEKTEKRKEEKAISTSQMEKAVMVVKVIAIAASIQAAKAQDEEEGEEGDAGALSFMVSVYTVLIILLTILAQWIWNLKVAVEGSRAPEGSSSTDFRSLPVFG